MALNEETLFAGTYPLFFCKDIFSQPRLNILIFLPILGSLYDVFYFNLGGMSLWFY